jgi:hypothetical protein
MTTNWSKILLFSLLSFALGFLVARTCCHEGACDKGAAECHGKSMCDHGGACCSGEGTCDKAGCDHKMGGACCKGGGHGEGKGACCKGGHGHMDADDQVHVIIDGLKEKNFQGDTTIAIDGGTVHVNRSGDKMEVKVEMIDSLKVEKTVEVHTH